PRAWLSMEMGLGKTATVLQAHTPEHGRVLVVAPKRVAERVWPAEGAQWRPDLSVQVAAGTAAKRRAVLESSEADVIVLGRDNLSDAVPVRRRFRTVVLDELDSFRSRDTVRWAQAHKVCQTAAYVWGLTGTPIPTGYLNLWAEMALVDRGVRLGRSLTRFRARYFVPPAWSYGGQYSTSGKWEIRTGAASE